MTDYEMVSHLGFMGVSEQRKEKPAARNRDAETKLASKEKAARCLEPSQHEPVLPAARRREAETAPASEPAARRREAEDDDRRAHAKPFIKWVGGKRQLVPELLKHVPKSFRRYHEPFMGGGALFYALFGGEKRAGVSMLVPDEHIVVLSDANPHLVRTTRALKHNVEGVIELLQTYKYEKEFYASMRARDPFMMSDTEISAWFIYLNRTCFNGLYRVNKAGHFNVPFGRYTNPLICDAENLRLVARALEHVFVQKEDFRDVLGRGNEVLGVWNDFFYFDPPYVPLSTTSDFKSYTAEGFTLKDQEALRDVALELVKREAHVLISNSDTPVVRELYQGFEMRSVGATRSVNSKGDKRGKVGELIIWKSPSLERDD